MRKFTKHRRGRGRLPNLRDIPTKKLTAALLRAVTNEPVLFQMRNTELNPSTYDIQLVGHEIHLRGQNPYGEVESGTLKVTGLTKRFVRSEQVLNAANPANEIGTTRFDEPENGGGAINALSSVFKVTDGDSDYLLCVNHSQDQSWEHNSEEWNIDYDSFSKHDYIALMILADHEEDADGLKYVNGECLVLRKLDGTKGTFVRAGYLRLSTRSAFNFENWMKIWEIQNIEVI